MGEGCLKDGSAAWRDTSRTTCEVMKDLYGAMREAAGDDMIIIGCNALNHLAAGLFELPPIGVSPTASSCTNGEDTVGTVLMRDK